MIYDIIDPMTNSEVIFPPPSKIKNWAGVLWREYRFCHDRDYAQFLRRTLWAAPWSWVYSYSLRRQSRPYVAQVEAAIYTASEAWPAVQYQWQKRLARLDEAKQKNSSISELID